MAKTSMIEREKKRAQKRQKYAQIRRDLKALIKNKNINEDDLSNPIKTYQTDFLFIKEDIERFRKQNMNHECF